MGKIRKILETELVGGTQSTDVYPVTSTKAVYDENNIRLDTILKPATKEATGLMSSEDKNKIDNYVGTRLNVPNITYVNPELQEEYTSIGYEGIKYTNGVCTFNVSNGDINIKSDNIKINETEISYTRGSNSTTLNQTGLIVDDTSTESFDSSTHRITITSNNIKYKYFIDNSMNDGESKSGDYTYTFPDKSGTIELVDEEKDNKLKQITNTDDLNIGYQYSTSFSSLEELANYVNNNPTTEQYMSYINNEEVGSFLLTKNGEVSCSVMSDTIGFTVLKGTLDFDNKEVINEKIVGFDTNEAILPNCIKILDDVDNNKAYELNIAKCLELGILTEVNKSSINAKAKKINF